MPTASSVTKWIEDAKSGDQKAAQEIWKRFFAQLLDEARKWVSPTGQIIGDEADVVAKAFESFFCRATEGYFPNLNDRESLWTLLLTLVERKAIETAETRGGETRDAHGTPASGAATTPIADGELTADLVDLVGDQLRSLLQRLGPSATVQVALLRLQDYTVREISETLGCSETRVFRELGIIRRILEERPVPLPRNHTDLRQTIRSTYLPR
jgi:RNA polymerase sigma-70 factor (ECF subfamily)